MHKNYFFKNPFDFIKSLLLTGAGNKNRRFNHMNQPNEMQYSIPARLRKMENLHIAFWLMKDISWCMIWKELGLTMIVPTLSVAIWIAWKNRHIVSELAHNLAIVFWITANAYWMISEFFGFDEDVIWNQYTGKHIALIPFVIGILIMLYYYAVQKPGETKKKHTVTM